MEVPHPTRIEERTNIRGDKYTTYIWLLPPSKRPVLNEEIALNMEITAVELTRALLAHHLPTPDSADRVQIILGRGGFDESGIESFNDTVSEAISTTFLSSPPEALEYLESTIRQVSERYDDASHLIINDIKIIVMQPNQQNGAASMRKFRTVATKIWLVPGEYNTQKNCFYWAWGMLACKERFAREYSEWLNGSREAYPCFRDYANKKKRHMLDSAKAKGVPFTTSYVNDEQIAFIARVSQNSPIIRIYNDQFAVVFEWSPSREKITDQTPLYEMQRSQNHYRPMIQWRDVAPEVKMRIEKGIAKQNSSPPVEDKARIIRPVFKAREDRDRRFVSWDLEATPDATGGFKVYAAGMAWYQQPFDVGNSPPPNVAFYYDGPNRICYVDFWGTDAMTQMVNFIAAHQTYFDNSYFWAHNGGKFDVPLMLRETLFNFDAAIIQGDKCTIINGRWIGFSVLFQSETGEANVFFRDSFAIMSGSLAKLCKDYGVRHPPMKEAVNHDDITIDNFHTFTQLPGYLLHDCLGLLELIDQFGEHIFKVSYTEKTERHLGERDTANVLEALLGLPHMSFCKKRPAWLKSGTGKRLELDGYCESVQIAFEYQDEYHFKELHPFNKKAPGGYEKRVADDASKVTKCAEHGVRLVVVPFTERAHAKLLHFIKQALNKQGVDYDKQQIVTTPQITRGRLVTKDGRVQRGGICLSQVMTAAGIAKRIYFNNFYGKHIVYTLTRAQDKYIRTSYYGGRVELFRLGVVYGPVYYLDYTSLFPAMGHRHHLPHGEPISWSSFPQNQTLPKEFFGFVRCLVRSTEKGKTLKPLHGIKNASNGDQLLFSHIGAAETDWLELTLFSEELRKGQTEGLYDYRAIDGIGFKRGYVMREANETLFAQKSEAKKNGQPALERAMKIVVNSMYGFWGLRTEGRESVKIYPSNDVPVYDFLAKNALIEEADHGKYTCLRVLADLNVTDFNVAIAAAITSYARIELWTLMNDIERRNGTVYSCDTDSITTNFDLSADPDLLAKHVPDWDTDAPGTRLGSLKCEGTDEMTKVLKKLGFEGDALKKALALERGSETWKPLAFEHPEGTLVNGANKLYCLRTLTKHGGEEIVISKAKGLSKHFKFGDYAAMFDAENPKPLTDPGQLQFRMGLGAYCTEGGIQPVRKMVVEKKAYAQYKKGHCDPSTGVITPFLLPGTVNLDETLPSSEDMAVNEDTFSGDSMGWGETESDDDWDGPDE